MANITLMETFTIREAAARCGVTYQTMRKRVDRGTLRSVKQDGVRLIPRAELERAGLWPGSQPVVVPGGELATLRAELAAAQAELDDLRPLRGQLGAERDAREHAEQAMHAARAGEQTAAAQLAEIEAQAAEHARLVSRLTSGSVFERWRARREFHADSDTAPPTPATTTT